MLVDTHIHLDAVEFDADRAAVIAAARAAGIARFVVPAVEVANFDRVAALSATNADIVHAFGIHPMYVGGARGEDLDILQERLAHGRAVAVGEIGLDFYGEDFDRATQEQYFVEQLKLARRFGLPVILHVRRAVDDILKQLRRIEVPGGIAHAFNGSRQQADAFIALGFRLGFGGAMTFDGSRRIRNLAATLPLDSIVLETDAPDIPPAWAQGRRNEPADLRRFAEVLAGLRGLSVAEVTEATGRNACAVLPALACG
ncbi:TatD family hydrolase [Aromatoleum petrolei]|uniref:TatD family deoxyribonuclease n=1 Tax=Aromatoleum petrolei TaxID=76116 RepID=A0ABX1MK43_9RHOO|nr:TatD family hydrolase [Aromatoleum petrolei]NMF87576.1 TatD family deoxyribonuclease [Aromatoleum petrolei]QTQ38673.1 Putative deoxyribonuclease, TatD-related [Aromatoleum petrolei]